MTNEAIEVIHFRLSQLYKKWSAIIDSERCPAVLGLLGLSEAECDEISDLVKSATEIFPQNYRIKPLRKLLDQHPAVIAMWLARKAGEAYDLGAFWDRFGSSIGIEIQPNERPQFARHFRETCSRVMFEYAKPPEPGALKYVETFLFQAGLPLCYCDRFANLIHQVERHYGLPDPASPDSGAELRDHVLALPDSNGAPLFRRALRGAAGPLICHTALRVVLEADYEGINPMLGRALAHAFAHVSGSQLRRSARQPYLRLSSDLCSLEIVAPRQDEQIRGTAGLEWLVDGRPYPTPFFDELVIPVGQQPRISVELRGLRGGLTATRSFVIRLADRHQPFMLFDGETRKLLRDEIGQNIWIPSGEYLLLHPQQFTLRPAGERYDWPDGDRALSQLSVRPNTEVRLEGTDPWIFRGSQDPYIEFQGGRVLTDDQECIHFGWTNLPRIWHACDIESQPANLWSMVLNIGDKAETWQLSNGVTAEGMTCSQPEGTAFLGSLSPGLHQVKISVFLHQRRKLCQSLWLWIGLNAHRPGHGFDLSALPKNLRDKDCCGFQISATSIRHQQDKFRRHCLAFDVGSDTRQFCWTQQGLFLESFEKRIGRSVSLVSHKLRETFSASVDSDRWLRIWCVPATNVKLLVNGEPNQRMHAGARPYFDLSLAHLSAAYPQGGEICIEGYEQDVCAVASFARPLVANSICRSSLPGFRSLDLGFREIVSHVRMRVTELATNQEFVFSGEELLGARCVFRTENFPEINCTRVDQIDSSENQHGCTVRVNALNSGWPTGFWILELEVRRDELSDWQLVTNRHGHRAPLLMAAPRNQPHLDWRIELFSAAYIGKNWVGALDLDDSAPQNRQLFALLSQILQIVQRPFATEVKNDFKWLEVLIHRVAGRVSKLLRQASDSDVNRLLDLASRENDVTDNGSASVHTRSPFVMVPGLIALSSERYSEISPVNPLARALQWCGRLAMQDFVFDRFRELIEQVLANPRLPVPDTYKVLQLFDNFAYAVQSNGDGLDPTEFFRFDYVRYIDRLIGPFQRLQAEPEWDERSALGRSHAEWALGRLDSRLHEAGPDWGAINALLNTANSFRHWLMQMLGEYSNVVRTEMWHRPWLQVSLPDRALMENCSRFASVFALSARASAAGWLKFEDVTQWWIKHGDHKEKTISAIVGLAPELLGFYLMFWELMIRTYPHE